MALVRGAWGAKEVRRAEVYGTLDDNEVVSSATVCNGNAGPVGATGVEGSQGPAGPTSLLAIDSEPPGVNCPNGGVLFRAVLTRIAMVSCPTTKPLRASISAAVPDRMAPVALVVAAVGDHRTQVVSR